MPTAFVLHPHLSVSLPSALTYRTLRSRHPRSAYPSMCATTAAADADANADADAATPHDLLIVGAGTLGRLIATQWRAAHPQARIVGETRTPASHARLRQLGVTPALAGATQAHFPRVVFCAPPSAADDYAGAAGAAAARVRRGGRLAFTSSASVHGADAPLVTERTPRAAHGRAGVLGEAERRVLACQGGRVVRLAGLYLADRGPHAFWLRRGSVGGGAHGRLNMVHYADAASAVVRALEFQGEDRVFLAAVKSPVTRREICEAGRRHPWFEEFAVPQFEEGVAKVQRHYDNSRTREVLGWEPEFESFVEFMEMHGRMVRREEGKEKE